MHVLFVLSCVVFVCVVRCVIVVDIVCVCVCVGVWLNVVYVC